MLIYFFEMNLETALNEYTIDKSEVYDDWINRCCEDSKTLESVIEKAFEGSVRERKRANWILHHVSDKRPEVFVPYLTLLKRQLERVQTEAELRFILRYFSKYQLPNDEESESYLIDFCFEMMLKPREAQAPRVYSMSVLHRLVKRYPELATEFDQSIEVALEHASASLRSRAKHVRKDLIASGLI